MNIPHVTRYLIEWENSSWNTTALNPINSLCAITGVIVCQDQQDQSIPHIKPTALTSISSIHCTVKLSRQWPRYGFCDLSSFCKTQTTHPYLKQKQNAALKCRHWPTDYTRSRWWCNRAVRGTQLSEDIYLDIFSDLFLFPAHGWYILNRGLQLLPGPEQDKFKKLATSGSVQLMVRTTNTWYLFTSCTPLESAMLMLSIFLKTK